MARANEVRVNIVGDADSAVRALNKVEKEAGGFGSKMGGILGAVGGAAIVSGVVGFGKASAEAFKESEQSANQLNQAFEKFPALADSNTAAFNRVGEALAKKTRFDDDAVSSGQAVLAQFGLTGQQITSLTPLLADYAAKTGTDLPTAAEQLGKGLLGSGKALKQVGIDFKDAGSVGANFDQIMGGLRTQVGGFAESEGKTASGRAAIMSNQFGELQEAVGAKLVPALSTMAGWLTSIIGFFANLSPGVQAAIGVVIGLAGAAILVSKAVHAWTAVQAAFNVVMGMNPIGLIVIAIAALVAGIIWAYKNVSWFRDGVQSAFGAIAAAGQWIGRVFAGVWNGIVAGFVWVRDTLKSIANWLISNVVNRFVDSINLLIKAANFINPGKDTALIPRIPMLAEGGIVTGPTLAMIGEAGPEAVIPLSRAGGMGMGGSNVTINFNGVTTREAADQVVKVLELHFGRGGALSNGRGGTLAPA